MKLIDILVRELPKRGGWPEGIKSVAQSSIDGELYFYDRPYDGRGCKMKSVYTLEINDEKVGCLTSVTRTQYEVALAASQKVEWDGAGLPPVGCECEFRKMMRGKPDEFRSGVVSYFSEHTVVIIVNGESGEFVHHPDTCEFRPIRSEADNKRDAAIKALDNWLPEYTTDIPSLDGAIAMYDAIAAGKIPGVKLED